MIDTPYSVRMLISGKFSIDGPGSFLHHCGPFSEPSHIFDTELQAEMVAYIMNEAYLAGKRAAKEEIRELLGAKKA